MKTISLTSTEITVQAGDVALKGDLTIPDDACGLVVFAHGSGSSRHSLRNRYVAGVLNQVALATLLFDLLTPDEELIDEQTMEFRFDITLLGKRMTDTVDWMMTLKALRDLHLGIFGASTGAAAALIAAAARPEKVEAVVARGGRADLADKSLPRVKAPTLLIVGGNDERVIQLNRSAMQRMRSIHEFKIIPGAGHLFAETGKLEQVARISRDWFYHHLCSK